jgi:hypothetical protein
MANPIEQVQTKTAGTAHAVKAGFNGLRGVFLHLAEEHGEVASLMKRVAKSTDADVRREHYPQVRAELLAHERAELGAIYSVLSQNFQTRGLAIAHQREAEELEAAIAAVDALDFASADWGAAFDRVLSLVERHVHQEENDFFPRAQRALGEAEAQALLASYEAAKKQVK